jgi:hypothetical protein
MNAYLRQRLGCLQHLTRRRLRLAGAIRNRVDVFRDFESAAARSLMVAFSAVAES